MLLIIVLEKYRQENQVPVYPELHHKFKANLTYIRLHGKHLLQREKERMRERNRDRETQR